MNVLVFKLALRFVRSRRKGALTRFISFASTCGIAIGVFAAIVGFSAMNGFEYELGNRVLSIIPSAQLNSSDGFFNDSLAIERTLHRSEHIVAVAPAIEQRAILSAHSAFAPLVIAGIDPDKEQRVIAIQRFVSIDLAKLAPTVSSSTSSYAEQTDQAELNLDVTEANEDEDNQGEEALDEEAEVLERTEDDLPRIVIGSGIAKKLQVAVGDTVEVVMLNNKESASSKELSQSLRSPARHKLLVVGIIHIGGQLDTTVALMHYEVLKEMTKLPGPNTIHIKTDNLQDTHDIVYQAIAQQLAEGAYLATWMSSQGKLYHDIQMVRQIMFVAMFLVLAVACFNIVSNLLMLVGEKRREIAILLTMGMKPKDVVRTFSLLGLLSGGYGTLLGLIAGVVFSLLLTPVTSSFHDYFGFDLLNEDVYFINFIPCRLELLDVCLVLAVSLLMSWGASLYPAWRASRIKAARELNL